MVELKEVTDEEYLKTQPTVDDEDEEWDTDDESDVESTTSSLPDESLYDRILALQDIVPPKTRSAITSSLSKSWAVGGVGLEYTGKALWVVMSSVLLVGIPFVIAYEDDREMAAQEAQARAAATANEFMSAPAGGEKAPAGL